MGKLSISIISPELSRQDKISQLSSMFRRMHKHVIKNILQSFNVAGYSCFDGPSADSFYYGTETQKAIERTKREKRDAKRARIIEELLDEATFEGVLSSVGHYWSLHSLISFMEKGREDIEIRIRRTN